MTLRTMKLRDRPGSVQVMDRDKGMVVVRMEDGTGSYPMPLCPVYNTLSGEAYFMRQDGQTSFVKEFLVG